MFWPALALALLGALTVRGDQRVTLALAAGFAGFMFWVAAGAGYHYGHFKNLSYVAFLVAVLLASGIANIYHGEFKLWSEASTRRLEARLAPYEPALRRVAVGILTVLALALIYNTYLSVWWNWQGVGWNVERRIAHDARAVADRVPPGSRVFFGPHLAYPVPRARQRISEHTLGFHFSEHQAESWARRARGVWAGALSGRDVSGFASSPAFFNYQKLDDAAQDFVILNNADDPRTHGLLASDVAYSTPYWTLYRVAHSQRLTANDLGQALGSLDLSPTVPVRLGVRNGRLAVGANLEPAAQPISFGVVAATHGIVRVGASDVDVSPGLTWITAPAVDGAVLSVGAVGTTFTPQIVAARLVGNNADASLRAEHVARHVISIDIDARDGMIEGIVTSINPTGAGRNAGFTYREEPRRGGSPTHGFWESAARVVAPAQRIEVRYVPGDRTILEDINGRAFPPGAARDVSLHGAYRLTFHLARGFISDLAFSLIEYEARSGELQSAQPYRQTYVFDMPIRPLPDRR